MKTVYIDSDFKCHAANDGTMTAVETDAFDGKCDAYMEGHRFIPFGSSWIREDGEIFAGESVSPWVDCMELNEAQREYEQEQLADMKQALSVLGVTLDE